jgi:RNA polymerase sigma factor (sigma-70 family)
MKHRQVRGGRQDERFDRFYTKYFRRVALFFVRGFRVSQEDAEDLTQDVFMRFLDAMDEYRGDAERAFIETIALNVGRNRVRALSTAKRSAKTVDLDDPNVTIEPAAPEEPDYAERQQQALQQQALQEAIAALSPRQQQVIQLQIAGYKYGEMAKILRITLDAVRSSRRDAMRALRARLGVVVGLPEDDE